MTRAAKHIPFEELASDLASIFDRVAREGESIVVERGGTAIAVVKPLAPPARRRRERTAADHQAFLAAAGSWKDVDIDRFLADNAASRERSSRPAVEL